MPSGELYPVILIHKLYYKTHKKIEILKCPRFNYLEK
jgi:hypothetical protein